MRNWYIQFDASRASVREVYYWIFVDFIAVGHAFLRKSISFKTPMWLCGGLVEDGVLDIDFIIINLDFWVEGGFLRVWFGFLGV